MLSNRLLRAFRTLLLLCLFGFASFTVTRFFASERDIYSKVGVEQVLYEDQKERSLSWKQISPMRAYERFSHMASPSCQATCNRERFPGCAATTFSEWDALFKDGRVEGIPLLKDHEYIFSFEKEYLSFPPLEDLRRLPDLSRSVIYHLDNSGTAILSRRVRCGYLEKLRFRVDFVDGYGNLRIHGGDEVRVWMTGNPRNKSAHDFSLAGNVMDLHNGSYLATVTCAWTGHASVCSLLCKQYWNKPKSPKNCSVDKQNPSQVVSWNERMYIYVHDSQEKLKIGMAYPREYIRSALFNFQRGIHVFIAGIFKSGPAQEHTICQAHPNVPGRACLCNMTSWNVMPFFCGRPLDRRLTCDDLVATISMPNVPRLLYTDAEKIMSNAMSRLASQMAVHQDIDVVTTLQGDRELPKKPCSRSDKSLSWRFRYPRGFWSPGPVATKSWTSLICRQPKLTPSWIQKCLEDSNVWVFGDSNAKQIYKALLDWVPCKGMGGSHQLDTHFCVEKTHGINITYVLHGQPIYSNKSKTINSKVALRKYVDLIPNTGKHFVIFHYFLHPSRAHYSSLYIRLQETRRLIIRLLTRNKDIRIAVRGPHISTMQVPRNHMLGGDVLGTFHKALYHEMFRDLGDKVVFLDGWDMSVALENPDYHPIREVAKELTRTFLAFHCD